MDEIQWLKIIAYFLVASGIILNEVSIRDHPINVFTKWYILFFLVSIILSRFLFSLLQYRQKIHTSCNRLSAYLILSFLVKIQNLISSNAFPIAQKATFSPPTKHRPKQIYKDYRTFATCLSSFIHLNRMYSLLQPREALRSHNSIQFNFVYISYIKFGMFRRTIWGPIAVLFWMFHHKI